MVDLLTYLAIFFHINQHASSVIVVVGTGPWWRWATVARHEAPDYSLIGENADYIPDSKQQLGDYQIALSKKLRTREAHYLGEADSDLEWTRLRQRALIPMLRKHGDEYPDCEPPAVPTRQGGKGKGKAKATQEEEEESEEEEGRSGSKKVAQRKDKQTRGKTRKTQNLNKSATAQVLEGEAGPSSSRKTQKSRSK